MKALLSVLLLTAAAVPSHATADPYAGFEQLADAGSLKPFTRDLGGLLGSSTFHSGRSLGFSGFDVGVRYGAQFRPSAGDNIMRGNKVKSFGLPMVQAEIGLPFKIDGFIRGISYQGLTVSGGGVRYGVFSPSDKPWSPQVLIGAVGHSIVHKDFSATHFGANLVASAGNAAITPFVGAGFDRTRLVVRSSLLDPTLNGRDVTTVESRFTAGVSVKPYQFVYASVAANLVHGMAGAEADLGVRF
ncbi:MAG: hypothetical protein ACHQ51_06625 [Elusimicrobiota bacterium]